MAPTAFDDALELLDGIEKQRNSFLLLKDQTQILKQELRFLSTFQKYTANRCIKFKNWNDPLPRIKHVQKNIAELHRLAPSPSDNQANAFNDAVHDVLDKINVVKPEIREVQMKVSRLSASVSRMSDILVVEFVDSLLEDLKALLGCETNLLEPLLREGVKVLERKLTFLKRLLNFTSKRCKESDSLNQLFTHVEAMAHGAAYLAYACLGNQMDEKLASVLARELSDLAQKIEPVKSEVRKIYVGVLQDSMSSGSNSNICKSDGETTVEIVESALENTMEILKNDYVLLKDQLEILHVELRSLRYCIKNEKKFTKPGKSIDLLAHMKVMAIHTRSLIYSLFNDEINQDIAEEMRLVLSILLKKFKASRVQSRKVFVKIQKAQLSNYFPKTDELGVMDLLLLNLKELLSDRVNSSLKHHIQIVNADLVFLGSFRTTIVKQHLEHEKLEDLCRRIIHVMYEVEYVIDSVVVKDGPVLHHMLWLSDLIEEIKFIKTEASTIQISGEKDGTETNDDTMICSSLELSKRNAPKTDGEMVGFKDEEKKVLERLVSEPRQLQIVSIVGMPGLGKTFLAQKVYSNPIIKDHFYVCAWCTISQVYERKELLINILSQVKKSTEDMSKQTDEEIAGELHKSLKGQRYLIVLDDVWNIGAWEALRRSFPNDNVGNRIVFTSRSSKLSLQAQQDSKIHRLRSLSDKESWELLQKKIFQTESCPLELLEVGQQIAKRCNGLPLAIVVVGGLLARTVTEEDHWKEVANCLTSYIASDPQRQCKDILELSYKSLPNYLKSCFLYFGAFQEDKEVSVVKLIQLWIAEGFVRKNEPNLEYIAEGYLMDLVDRSLIIDSKRGSTGAVKTCIIHDLVRDFCLAKAQEEDFFKVVEGCGDLLTSSTFSKPSIHSSYSTNYEHRRIFVHHRQRRKLWSKSSGPCVRSLLFFAPNRRIRLSPDEVSSIWNGFKLLRVLDMACINLGDMFPEGMGLLTQLRYLAVFGHFRSIPPSIANLQNLETFLVRTMESINLPYNILNMTKLRHLHANSAMYVFGLSSEDSSQLESLQTLSKPSLSYEDVITLKRFPNLRELSCILRGFWDSSKQCNQLPGLDFLSKLESLKVSNYYGQHHPLMSSLPSNIKKLSMKGFRLPWEQISIVGKLPNLEVLNLLLEAFEGHEWNMQEGEFLRLKCLKLKYLNIKRWIASSSCCPPLERLVMGGCTGLTEIPDFLEDIPTLKMIRVYSCPNSLKKSIKRIEEEQRDMGNEELQIEI